MGKTYVLVFVPEKSLLMSVMLDIFFKNEAFYREKVGERVRDAIKTHTSMDNQARKIMNFN